MIAHRRIRQISLTVPPSPPIVQTPGETITTLSGQATVTCLEQLGSETIAWADYGSGIEQPHTGEAISPHPKGTLFQDRRKRLWVLVAADSEFATLNREAEASCISTRRTWEEIDRLFTLTPPDAPTQSPAGNPPRKSNPRRRRRASQHSDSETGCNCGAIARNDSQDVLPPASQGTAASERKSLNAVEPARSSPLEQGDLIRAKLHNAEEWVEGYITRLGRTYARLNNDRYAVVLEGAELLKRNPLPYHLLKIVGLDWEAQADELLEHLHFGNLNRFYVAGQSTPVDRHRGWTIACAQNGNQQEFEISKDSATWYLRDRQHDRLKTDERRIKWCKHAIDHVESCLARLEELLGKSSGDFPDVVRTPEFVNQTKAKRPPGIWFQHGDRVRISADDDLNGCPAIVDRSFVADDQLYAAVYCSELPGISLEYLSRELGFVAGSTPSALRELEKLKQLTSQSPEQTTPPLREFERVPQPATEPTRIDSQPVITSATAADSQPPLEQKFKVGDRVRIIEPAPMWVGREGTIAEVPTKTNYEKNEASSKWEHCWQYLFHDQSHTAKNPEHCLIAEHYLTPIESPLEREALQAEATHDAIALLERSAIDSKKARSLLKTAGLKPGRYTARIFGKPGGDRLALCFSRNVLGETLKPW